ncbi:SH3 domain-containing protein [Streptomyces sp. NPDC090306]|uniref:SH3 domain-containing protein n=1 Tax=unclassified Streptomyces TaxID=2593676 RepID=UPI0036E2815F
MSLRSSSLRSALTRLAIVTAAGALAAGAAVTPAVADDGWGGSDSGHGRYDDGQQVGGDRGDHGRDNPRRYKGRITANGGLTLRSAPNRGARIIRVARQGEIVSIYCKTSGDNVQGNRLWYLLTDGTWAWGAAYYIDNIGPAPRWC